MMSAVAGSGESGFTVAPVVEAKLCEKPKIGCLNLAFPYEGRLAFPPKRTAFRSASPIKRLVTVMRFVMSFLLKSSQLTRPLNKDVGFELESCGRQFGHP